MYNIAICESDDISSESLQTALRCYFAEKSSRVMIRNFSTPEELARYSGQIDIAFIDADENHAGSVRTGKLLLSKNHNLFLYILSDKFAYLDEAMDLKAFRFLQKSIDVNRLFASLDIVTTRIRRITFVSNYVSISLKEAEVVCIYSKDRKTYVLTSAGVTYPTNISVKNWNEKLVGNTKFIQPHYSYIINVNYISRFDEGKIVLRCNDGKMFEVFPSQRKVGEFRRQYFSDLRIRNNKIK